MPNVRLDISDDLWNHIRTRAEQLGERPEQFIKRAALFRASSQNPHEFTNEVTDDGAE